MTPDANTPPRLLFNYDALNEAYAGARKQNQTLRDVLRDRAVRSNTPPPGFEWMRWSEGDLSLAGAQMNRVIYGCAKIPMSEYWNASGWHKFIGARLREQDAPSPRPRSSPSPAPWWSGVGTIWINEQWKSAGLFAGNVENSPPAK